MSWIFREGDQGHITLMNYRKLYRQSRVWVGRRALLEERTHEEK